MSYQPLSLTEFNNLFREIVELNFPDELWVIAEISEMSVNARGHCYIDFIERDELTGKINARQRATVWAFQYNLVKDYFEQNTGQELVPGLKVLVKVRVSYHVLYGLSFNVLDIDPAYTLGDQARYREQIIAQLENEGVLDMNQHTDMPEVVQRIAVISSETAAGYGDFVEHLTKNNKNYEFHIELFKAVMQGDKTSQSVVAALDAVYLRESDFDVVLIIRGGGARSELVSFDAYDIAFMISQSPIPVLTGIGHERDHSVADIVAWRAFKTPTAVANYILDKTVDFEQKIDGYSHALAMHLNNTITQYRSELSRMNYSITAVVKASVGNERIFLNRRVEKTYDAVRTSFKNHKQAIKALHVELKQTTALVDARKTMLFDNYTHALSFVVRNVFSKHYHYLDIQHQRAMSKSPSTILKSGYGFVTHQGKRIHGVEALAKKDKINVSFIDGIVRCVVSDVERKSFIDE